MKKDSKLDSAVHSSGNDFMKRPEPVGLSIGIYTNGKSYFYNFGTMEKGKHGDQIHKIWYNISL